MQCERCANVATESLASVEWGWVWEVHLCAACAGLSPDFLASRNGKVPTPPHVRPFNVHDSLRRWNR